MPRFGRLIFVSVASPKAAPATATVPLSIGFVRHRVRGHGHGVLDVAMLRDVGRGLLRKPIRRARPPRRRCDRGTQGGGVVRWGRETRAERRLAARYSEAIVASHHRIAGSFVDRGRAFGNYLHGDPGLLQQQDRAVDQ